MKVTTAAFADSKQHYLLLDGLRGIASLMVVVFHIFETHAANRFEQIINHGYLAVDFFFVLSGFVIGYAYDDRWSRMSTGEFFKRRLVRLHPMIVIAALIGLAAYFFQAGNLFAKIQTATPLEMMWVFLLGLFLIPIPVAWDVRGWQEMFPFNGPAWSLFFEYVANILYALIVRRFSNGLLAALVFLSGCVLIHYTVTGERGDVLGGWSLESQQFQLGLTRLMYPFFAGLLLSRCVKPGQIQHAFAWCSAAIILVLIMPRIGGPETTWMNGIYESFCIIVVFPLIVYCGASGRLPEGRTAKWFDFLGALSYPLYITHYAFIYTYTAWVVDNKLLLQDTWPVAIATFVASVVTAYLCLRFYDIPVRRWLTQKWIGTAQKN